MDEHFTKVDLAARWGVSRQLVNYRANAHDDFPEPEYHVGNSRFPVYSLAAVQRYEKSRGIKGAESNDSIAD